MSILWNRLAMGKSNDPNPIGAASAKDFGTLPYRGTGSDNIVEENYGAVWKIFIGIYRESIFHVGETVMVF